MTWPRSAEYGISGGGDWGVDEFCIYAFNANMRNTNPTTSDIWAAPAGTVVRTPRGLYSHVGILTPPILGRERTVISLNPGLPGRQVLEETLTAFCRGNGFRLEQAGGELNWAIVLQRARSGQHPPYAWLTFNCEHFVRFAHGLLPESPQLKVFATLAAIATFALASA